MQREREASQVIIQRERLVRYIYRQRQYRERGQSGGCQSIGNSEVYSNTIVEVSSFATLPVYPNTNPLDQRHQPLQNKSLSQFNKNQSSRKRGLFPKMDSNFSSLEAFMMLRSVTALPGVKRKADRSSEDSEEPEMKKCEEI